MGSYQFEKKGETVLKKKRYLVIACLFAAVFLVSAILLGMQLHRYRQADVLYSDLQYRYVTVLPREEQQPSSSADAQGTASDPNGATSQEPAERVTAPIRVDFDALLQENGDVVGWLYCEDTVINYPVLRAGDNDHYLHRDLNGNYLVSGSLFVDYRCSAVGTGQNCIIYGHNMKNKTMFGTLAEYKAQEYYDAHPVLWYLTPDGDYRIELFAGLVTAADSEVYTPAFSGAEAFGAFLREIVAESTFVSDVTVTEEDHIVTLSTCSYEFGNARYVVFGKLNRIPD